jgi:hypothetical protein
MIIVYVCLCAGARMHVPLQFPQWIQILVHFFSLVETDFDFLEFHWFLLLIISFLEFILLFF